MKEAILLCRMGLALLNLLVMAKLEAGGSLLFIRLRSLLWISSCMEVLVAGTAVPSNIDPIYFAIGLSGFTVVVVAGLILSQ